jgi:2-keto-3-deoxy-L-rhamnonate aldolase RhmA
LKNRTKELLSAGKVAVGAQLRFGSPAIAELMALAGFDWIIIDTEHAPQTPNGVLAQIQAISRTDTTPLVRIGNLDTSLIRLYLDMGAMGIVIPFINTAEEARLAARACRYPPAGTRGYGPWRADKYGLDPDYFVVANDNTLFCPIIEDVKAVENIDAILAVEGVDAPFVGGVDLSVSLGVPLQVEHARVQDAVQSVVEAAKRAGKPAGIHTAGTLDERADFERRVKQGFRMMLLTTDQFLVRASAASLLDSVSGLR